MAEIFRGRAFVGLILGGCQRHRGVVEACSCKAGGCRLAVREIFPEGGFSSCYREGESWEPRGEKEKGKSKEGFQRDFWRVTRE